MSRPKDDAVVELLRRIEVLEAERRGRQSRRRLALPLATVAVWTLSAAAPDLESRVAALEGLIRKGVNGGVQVRAPFDVVGSSGKPILRVSATLSTEPLVGVFERPGSGGLVAVNTSDGREALLMGATKEDGSGLVWLTDGKGHVRTTLTGQGTVAVTDVAKTYEAELTTAEGLPAMNVVSGGKRVAEMTIHKGNGAGRVTAMNAAGSPGAIMTAGKNNYGTIAVVDPQWAVRAEMSITTAGHGFVQTTGSDGVVTASMSRAAEYPGGLLQVRSAKGHGGGSLMVGPQGAGYLQLINEGGAPVVEAGLLEGGRGAVRAGPKYLCEAPKATALVQARRRPDCIVGQP